MKSPTLVLAGIVVAGMCQSLGAQTYGDEVVSERVDAIVLAQMREQKIPGVSLAVMRDGKVIKASGYGLASIELNVPVKPEMVFHSASLAKAFTATAVMMLVEEGKIGLDDKAAKYLPEAPAVWNEATIRRLLTHTSGIRDFFGEDGDPEYDFHTDVTEDELVRKFAAQTMRFAPGEKWSYRTAGYVILGVVIHRVTGKFCFDFAKERIFDPLGMTSVRILGTDDTVPNRVNGYALVKGRLQNEPWVANSWNTMADGRLYLNVFDMAKWDEALYTEKLINRSTLEQMWTPVKINDGTTYPYGFAWRIREVKGHRLIQHDGVDFAYTTRLAQYVNDRLSIIVFMNLGVDDEALMPTRMTDSVAAIYIPSLEDSKSQTSASDASKSTPSVPRAQPLSSQQAETWKGEENLQTYEQQKDLKRYLSIWDEHFVGWPDYGQRPAYKPEFEASAAVEFKEPGTTSPPLPAPKPLVIAMFGDVAVTHYFWPEADQSSPTVFRITHTWKKGPAGWHIIGGMSCEVPRTVPTQTPPRMAASSAAQPEDEKAAEETVRRYEQAVQEFDFAKANSLLAPNAKWIERSRPEPADEWPDCWQQAKAAGVRIAYHLRDFDTHVQGDAAWVALTIDGTFSADSADGQKLLAAQQEGGFFGPAANPREFRNTFVESEVLVKTPAGWKIALGHTSLLPTKQEASRTTARSDDVSSLDNIIDASYATLTGPVGAPRQWDRYLSLYDPDARFVSASADAAGHAVIHRWNREEYVAAVDDYLVKSGFIDRKLGCATNQFGTVATVRCGFEGLEQSKLVERGVAIFLLYHDGKRWWIQSVVWDQERPGNPVPAELLTERKSN